MKEHPILFKGEMVRAILEGRKTQTRRMIDASKIKHRIDWIGNLKSPYGSVGDRLWVKETFQPVQLASDVTLWRYTATDKKGLANWKPSIFMPRKASRLTLEITGIRCERLNYISYQDALAEGVFWDKPEFIDAPISAIDAYATLWESINGKGSWALNPWVWVLEFKKL